MLFFVQQLLSVVLAVDIEQIRADLAQLSGGAGTAVDPAEGFSVRLDLALQEEHAVLIRFGAQFLQERDQLVQIAEHRADRGALFAAAYQVAGYALAQHCAEGVDNDGLACAGFAGQGIKAVLKGDVRFFDHRDIFDMQQHQHGVAQPLSITRSFFGYLRRSARRFRCPA